MNKKDLAKFQKTLLEERTKILHHLETLSNSAKEEIPQLTGDEADIASADISQSSLHKIGKRETYLLKKIDLALEKIKEGTYGECANCGEQIAIGRLMARPVAELCIDCKQEQENQERKFSSRENDGFDGEDSAEESEEE